MVAPSKPTLAQLSSDSDRSEPLSSIIHSMLVTLPISIALACFWVALAAQPAH